MGALIFDGLCDGIFLFNQGSLSHAVVDATAFGILQAGRTRTLKRNIFLVRAAVVRFMIWKRQLRVSRRLPHI